MLKYIEKTYKCVDYGDVEKVINKVFKFGVGDYSIPCGQEIGNDAKYIACVDGKIDDYDMKDIQDAVDNKDPSKLNWRLEPAMNYCCQKGKIEPGTYLIDVSW